MKLVVIDPAHFHASLLQREMYPFVDPRVEVLAPLGPEVLDYLSRVRLFNSRRERPTQWDIDLHLSAGPLEGLEEKLRGHAGDVAVLAGRNRTKIDRILAALRASMHVLADKPWIIAREDMPKLEEALQLADRNGLTAYDIMTERFEVTSELQREFVSDREIFGAVEGVHAHSVHHLMKAVGGVPLRRPGWFFDIEENGEALADVGTHVVDLVEWTAFPDEEPVDYAADVRLLSADRWPIRLTPAQFGAVTGIERDSDLDYYCNNWVQYTWRGVPVELEIVWHWEAPAGGGDVYEAAFQGSRARIEIRQGTTEKHIPELYLLGVPMAAARAKVASLQDRWPGLGLDLIERNDEIRLVIPPQFRVGHEAHFAQVANRFFEYVQSPGSLPAWERPNMIAKYFVTTGGVELGRRS